MTRIRIIQLWPVMEAFRDGKRIEKRHLLEDGSWSDWVECFSPVWADGCEYRVAREPREVWVNLYEEGSGMVGLTTFPTKKAADERAHPKRIRAVRFVEVIE